MGRFLSPDWATKPEAVPYSDLDDPQSLNLYSYVRNNPVSRVDADGHLDMFCRGAAESACGGINLTPETTTQEQAAQASEQAAALQAQQQTTPAPTNPDGSPAKPPNPPPPGKDGQPNDWVRVPGSENRPDKWVPRDPVPSPKGGQPGASWDGKDGHWDVDNGNGNRTRWLPDGTQVDHYNNPIKNLQLPTTKQVVIGIGAVGTGYLIYRGIRMLPSLLPPLWPTIPLNVAIP
jgi:hypothetical protein